MGSIGDSDDETQPCDTQPFSLPSDDTKEEHFDYLLRSTWPFEETVPAEDELETQVMNFEGETQVLFDEGLETQVINFEGETQVPLDDGLQTQVLNLGGETQVLDDFVAFDNMDTQLLDEWNNAETDKTDVEESDNTVVLCDMDDLSDNDSVKVVGCSSADCKNTKQDDKTNKPELDVLSYEKTSVGVKMNFTSVRAAALRASGLAARSKTLNKDNIELCSSKTDNESLKEDHASEENNAIGIGGSLVCTMEIDGVEEDQMKGIRDKSNNMVGMSTVRRLFMDDDDKLDQNQGLNENYLSVSDRMDLLLCNEIAGLSYVDSQEPGDLSQANALDFVDKFLNSNDIEFDKGVCIAGSTAKNPKPASSIKGTQNLAKKSRLKSISGEIGIYDWDDNREDEGGGEFFSRQKHVLFDHEKDLNRSLSFSEVHTTKRTAKKAKVAEIKKNLTKKSDEQLNIDILDGMKAACSEKDLQDISNVGPDTQMAAEAMEELCLGLEVTYKDTDGITETTHKSSPSVEKEGERLPIKYPLRKRATSSRSEDFTRKSKQRKNSGINLSKELTVSSSKQTKNAGEQHKDLDKFVISPSSGLEQVTTCTPVASRTRQHGVTRQWIAENIRCDTSTGTLSYKKGRRSHRKLSDSGHKPVNQASDPETKDKPCEISKRAKANHQSFSVDLGIKRKTRSSLRAGTTFPSSDRECETSLCYRNDVKEKFKEGTLKYKVRDGIKGHAESSGVNLNLDVSPGERSKSVSTSTTPASCISSAAAASPICMGDEYLEQSCRKNLSVSFLVKEISSLISDGPEPSSMMIGSRKRRDMANVRVLFSHHLDDDIIKHQTKILAKLGASVAPSIREATHFVTDKFVRTRNMLEAIAFGKPIVTHLWLESCGQASCCIDERNYILSDAKKEKEFGFSLQASLARACQCPLLQGLKVWITPSTKPGVEILSSLVKSVHGLPVERIGRSVLNDEKIPDNLLALSCKEDYAACLPFLEKGGNVFSSELLLNGIVTQRLEYERHRLFDDHVMKTRSTRWVKRDNNQYLPIAECK